MIHIDGSYAESGGAMLRQSLGYSMLLQKPFEITNIRAKRPKPGLSWQHLHALNAAQRLCDAKITGNFIGSEKVTFIPNEVQNTSLNIDITTAGSITLVLQTFILPALFGKKEFKIKIKGGTDVKWSIPVDYMQNVFLPHLRKYANISLRTLKRGFYPRGGGLVEFKALSHNNANYPPINLMQKGELLKIGGISFASNDLQPTDVAQKQAHAAKIYLQKEADIESIYASALSTGSGITLWAIFDNKEDNMLNPIILGTDVLTQRRLTEDEMGQEIAHKMKTLIDSPACVDEFLADQLLPILSVVGGKMKIHKFSEHLKSNVYLAEKFTDAHISINGNNIEVTKGIFDMNN